MITLHEKVIRKLYEDEEIEIIEESPIIDDIIEICGKINKSISVNNKTDKCLITISEHVSITIAYDNFDIISIITSIDDAGRRYNCTRTISEITRVSEDLQTAALVIEAITTKLGVA